MAEGVKFWLENKNVAGNRVGSLADQVLVEYRSRFYLVAEGAAVMKGGKPLRYSLTTLPADWKKILKEDAATTAAAVTPNAEPADPAKRPTARKARVRTAPMSESTPAAPLSEAPEKAQKAARKAVAHTAGPLATGPVANPPVQTSVPVECPYCQQKQEIPLEKGRSGKPFFQSCVKCQADFAVRFVAVTRYQAQVAGFP